jgi:genome maintenance exonuclease 1
MKWNKLYKYPPCVRSTIDGTRNYEIGEERLPSVTTILKNTESPEKTESLARWRLKVGENEAERIVNEAARRGTAMHSYLETYVKGGNLVDLTDVGQDASSMGQEIIDQGFNDLEEIWGSEVTLYYPKKYAGQTDLCGIYQGRESIVDFKQTNKPKKIEWIEDMFLQLAAYAMAHDQVYGTRVEQGVILMCSKDGFFQRFIVNGKKFTEYRHKFLEKISEYYKKNSHAGDETPA